MKFDPDPQCGRLGNFCSGIPRMRREVSDFHTELWVRGWTYILRRHKSVEVIIMESLGRSRTAAIKRTSPALTADSMGEESPPAGSHSLPPS